MGIKVKRSLTIIRLSKTASKVTERVDDV